MMGILSFFLSPTSVLAPLAALAFGLTLGFGGGFLKGHDVAVAQYQVASLREEVNNWKKAAEDKEKIIEEDRKLAESQAEEIANIQKLIKEASDDPTSSADTCKLSSDQLHNLRRLAGS